MLLFLVAIRLIQRYLLVYLAIPKLWPLMDAHRYHIDLLGKQPSLLFLAALTSEYIYMPIHQSVAAACMTTVRWLYK